MPLPLILDIKNNRQSPHNFYILSQYRQLDNMAKKKGEGFHSAAGLIRYFDEEDEKSLKVPPWLVVGFCVGSSILVTAAHFLWPV